MNKEENEPKQSPPQEEEEDDYDDDELHTIPSPNHYYSASPQSNHEQQQQQQQQQQQASQRSYVFSSPQQSSHTYVFDYPPQHQFKPPSPSPPPTPTPQPMNTVVDGDVGKKVEEEGGNNYRARPSLSILRRAKWDNMKRKALLVFRILSCLFCLLSFSVLAADKNQGWALDSFYNYKEFRYCMALNIIGFVYSGFQAYSLAYSLTTKKLVNRNQLRYYLDFSLDQIMAYLLLSASASASFRIEDWESNWGKDNFPTMAKASVAFSYLAFCAFALSCLISGHTLSAPIS